MLEQATPIADPPAPPDMPKLMALAAKFQIDIHGPLPEEPANVIGASKSDVEVIEAIRQTHVAALNARDAVVQFICSDMWKPYLKVIREKCCNGSR